jgi:hypothetical protein
MTRYLSIPLGLRALALLAACDSDPPPPLALSLPGDPLSARVGAAFTVPSFLEASTKGWT